MTRIMQLFLIYDKIAKKKIFFAPQLSLIVKNYEDICRTSILLKKLTFLYYDKKIRENLLLK